MANTKNQGHSFGDVFCDELQYIKERRKELFEDGVPQADWTEDVLKKIMLQKKNDLSAPSEKEVKETTENTKSEEDVKETTENIEEEPKEGGGAFLKGFWGHHTESGEEDREAPSLVLHALKSPGENSPSERGNAKPGHDTSSTDFKEKVAAFDKSLHSYSKTGSIGLALSGGGIRSATFNLGVIQSLARHNVLKYIDYLSTVSGGGYIGSCLTSLLSNPEASVVIGQKKKFPFQFDREEGMSDERLEVKWLRKHGKYLASSMSLFSFYPWRMVATYLSGLVLTNITTLFFVILIGGLSHVLYESLPVTSDYLFQTSKVCFGLLIALRFAGSVVNLKFKMRQIGGVVLSVLMGCVAGFWVGACLIWLAGNVQWVWWEVGTLINGLSATALLGLLAGIWKNRGILGRIFKFSWVVLIPLLVAQFLNWAWTSDFFVMSFNDVLTRVADLFGFSFVITVPFVQFFATPNLGWVFFDICLLFLGVLLNTNRINNHHFYRDRLSESYIVTRTGDEIRSNENIRLKTLHDGKNGAPYQLINATLNVAGSRNRYLRGRGADFFLFSKAYCGSDVTGYCKTDAYESGDTRLATAMAISGAAANPSMGTDTSSALRFLMTLFNVRLNRWMPNPQHPTRKKIVFWPLYFLNELLGRETECDKLLNLSDGGHHENLGLYSLIKRGCRFVIVSDVGADPNSTFIDLANVLRKVRIDLGVRIDLKLNNLRPKLQDNGTKTTNRHFVKGKIHYPNGMVGELLYIKSAITGDESEDLLNYRREKPQFPDETTGDQFFDEAQFESYRKLGEISVKDAIQNWSGKP